MEDPKSALAMEVRPGPWDGPVRVVERTPTCFRFATLAGHLEERARDLMLDYEFADPSIVRAVYAPDSPLEGRDMLLEVRFLGLRFRVGVRVAGVVDETSEADGRTARVWGWSYRTLQGHLEMGQMDYEVWKWLDSGDVQFRIHVVSRPARISGRPAGSCWR
jgi:uncharacterized protein (UPF0548 family)